MQSLANALRPVWHCAILLACMCHQTHGIRFADHGPPNPSCLKFVEYLPSKWESEWLHEASARQGEICQILNQEREKSAAWLNAISLGPDQGHILGHTSDPVWSFYKFTNTCSDGHTVLVPIEPLVGLLRSPFAAPCDQSKHALTVEDRNYLFLAPPKITATYQGRRLLFDLGSGSSFQSSLLWFIEGYSERGVHFDEIWCWEAAETNPHAFWETVPDEYFSKLHFYNTFATDSKRQSAPLEILQRHFRQGDFVVIKLDIDNEDLESSIMQQMVGLQHMIGEVFFEKHFDAAEMRPYFGTPATTYTESLKVFHKYRSEGMRMHYWP